MRSFFYSCLRHDTLNSKSTSLLASNKMKSGTNVGKLELDVKDGVREDYYLLKKCISFSSSVLIERKLDYFRFHFVHLKKS